MFYKRDFFTGWQKQYAWYTVLAGLVCMAIIGFTAGHYVRVIREGMTGSSGTSYFVAPDGNDKQTGTDKDKPLATIQKAINRAQPGDIIVLSDGEYFQSVTTVRSGTKKQPITITGSKSAVVFGSSSRIVEVNHDFLTLKGFQINGKWAPDDTKQSFRDKLIYAIGRERKKGVEGLRLTNMLVQNAGGECIRLRYFARENEISHSTIKNCGVYDFRFNDGGKNGEGIYIGTAPEQRKDGKNPTADPDVSAENHIHHNTIETNGNECVDIKEAATDNLVENNICIGQLDPESGGFDARGNNNTFRFNVVRDTIGAAVRLGGDTQHDGQDNNVYGNTFNNNLGGALKIQRLPQGKLCGNSLNGETSRHTDTDSDNYINAARSCN